MKDVCAATQQLLLGITSYSTSIILFVVVKMNLVDVAISEIGIHDSECDGWLYRTAPKMAPSFKRSKTKQD